MNLIKVAYVATLLCAISLSATSASAKSEAFRLLINQYSGSGASCFVCHTGSPGALTTYGVQYVDAGGAKTGTLSALTDIETLDADGDTLNNALEFRAKKDPVVSDFSGVLGTSASGDVLVSGGFVSAVSITPATSTDLYSDTGVTLASNQQILGGVSVILTLGAASPVTVTFQEEATGTVTLYEAGNTTPITPTVNASGNITFTPSTTAPAFYVLSSIPITPRSGTEQPVSGGCLTGVSSSFDMLVIVFLLSLIVFVRRFKC